MLVNLTCHTTWLGKFLSKNLANFKRIVKVCQSSFILKRNPPQEVWSIFNVTVISISGIITSLLSITRYVKIIRPFVRFRIRPLLCYISANTIFLLIILTRNIIFCGQGYMDSGQPYWIRFQQISWRERNVLWQMVVAVPYLGHCLASLITSFLTIYHLRRTRRSVITETRTNCRQSSYAIVLMNLGNSLFLVFMSCAIVLHTTQTGKIYDLLKLNFLKDCFSPCFLSALNPLIYYICCRDFRSRLSKMWLRSTMRTAIAAVGKRSHPSSSCGKGNSVVRNPAFDGVADPTSSYNSNSLSMMLKKKKRLSPPPPPKNKALQRAHKTYRHKNDREIASSPM